MKVKDLIEKLEEYDDELEVVLSSDEEGNYFSSAGIVSDGVIDTSEKRMYKVGEVVHTENLYNEDDPEIKEFTSEKVVVIYPW